MFVGHYSAGFALKAWRPQVPLWVLLLATQLVDVAWGLLVLGGVEKLRIVPGFLAGSPLDLYYMPYTHSLVAALIWALAAGVVYAAWRRGQGAGAALAVALAVASHWLLDLLVHAPDLPLYGNQHKLGFGLWAWRGPELLLELALVWAAVALYVRRCPQHAQRAWILAAVLTLMQLAHSFGPVPPGENAMALSALLVFVAVAWGGARVERGG
ncbi:MAG TPA: hypothetical protein VGE51_07465 [Fontimonas sp.]